MHIICISRRSQKCTIFSITSIINYNMAYGDVVALLIGHQTCDLQVAGLSSGWAPLRNGLGQATYTCVPLSPSSILWYRPRGVISLVGKVTAGLVESNGL